MSGPKFKVVMPVDLHGEPSQEAVDSIRDYLACGPQPETAKVADALHELHAKARPVNGSRWGG